MKRYFTLIAVTALAYSLYAQPNGGPVDMAGDLKQAYTAGKNKIPAAAEQMPESGYSFQPISQVRTFGQWVGHVADEQAAWCGPVAGNVKDLAGGSKTTKEDLLACAPRILRDLRCRVRWNDHGEPRRSCPDFPRS